MAKTLQQIRDEIAQDPMGPEDPRITAEEKFITQLAMPQTIEWTNRHWTMALDDYYVDLIEFKQDNNLESIMQARELYPLAEWLLDLEMP